MLARPARKPGARGMMLGVRSDAFVRRSQYSTSGTRNMCGESRMSASLMAMMSYWRVTRGVSAPFQKSVM